MKNKKEIRWIQLSDLHMFDSAEVIRQKKALYNQFSKKIDFLVITGDLHQYGKDYSLSKEFLEELVVEMQIAKKDIIIVPGNHDVQSTKKREEIIKNIDNKVEANPHIYLENLDKLFDAFREYEKFLKDFYKNDVDKFDFVNNNIYVWENSIAILCLNTALISDENHLKPQIIDIKGLEGLDNNVIPCIAIMHHNYYDISDVHKSYIQVRMKELGVSAVLSGHKHKCSANEIGLGNGETIPIFSCAKSVSEPGDLWSDVGLIEYRWKTNEKSIKVIPYEWDELGLRFNPSAKLENQENMEVDDNERILLKRSFLIRQIKGKPYTKPQINSKENALQLSAIKDFIEITQKQYLDGIIEKIGNDEKKFKYAIEIMKKIIWYKEKEVEFEEIMKFVISCDKKYVLAINGLQGTGKSTFLSLIYYQMMKDFQKTNLFPILIDLHYFEKFRKTDAKKMLQGDLCKINSIIKRYSGTRFLLMFDGADEYVRKTSELEKILYEYVDSHNEGNFAFCIGSAEKLPNEMIKRGQLQAASRRATYKVKTHQIDKDNDRDISFIIERLCAIYEFNANDNIIRVIKKAVNVYTINAIDYRTLLIILRIFDAVPINNRELQLGNYFYEYYMTNEMNGDEKELIKHAKAAYNYTVQKNRNALTNLKHAKIIYNNGITRDFLLAYYFVHLIKNAPTEQLSVLKNSNFVFTASVNKFIKDLLLNKYEQEQCAIVEKLIGAYQESDMSMKSQICYILGRIQDNNAKILAQKFLVERWNELYNNMFEKDILISQQKDIKNELVLFRTISVSLIWLEYYEHQERFLKCIILNERLNQINRGFHLEYYEDKAYINGESPTYVDDDKISVDKTMRHLMGNINKEFAKNGSFNKSINLDIITLFSIYQYRMDRKEIKEKYEEKLLCMADKILKSPKMHSKSIINYVTTIKELLAENPYLKLLHELYRVKDVKREGWIRRNVNLPESIADHMYGCYILGIFFLPNKVWHCIDYEIPDMDNYKDYSKETILQMLLLHDLAEVKIGDIVTYEKVQNDVLNENRLFDYYEFLCSFPKVYGLGNRKEVWDEFVEKSTINAKIANDIDKIEPVIQAAIYKEKGNKIDLKEWIDYACQNVCTTLGKQLLDFVIDSFCFQLQF